MAADVGSNEKLPAELQGIPRTAPAWIGVGNATSRPDGIAVYLTSDKAARRAVDLNPGTAETWPVHMSRVQLLEIKYCPDTNTADQLTRATDQHSDILQQLLATGRCATQTTLLLGAGGTIYKTHTKDALYEWGVRGERLTKLCNKLNRTAAEWATRTVGTRRHLEHSTQPQAGGTAARPGRTPGGPLTPGGGHCVARCGPGRTPLP